MKKRFISPSKGQLKRFKAANFGVTIKAGSEVNPRKCLLVTVLSSKRLNQGGYF